MTHSTSTTAAGAGPGEGAVRRPDQPRPVVVQNVSYATRPVDDPCRRWIAENLMVGATPQSVFEAMTAGGFSQQDSALEINQALQSPYLQAAERLTSRLRKRDWLLANYRKLNRLHPKSGEIERRHRISRDEFLVEYYCANRPVVITGMMDDWPAMRKWNLDYFSGRFGDREVEVQTGRDSSPNYEVQSDQFVGRARFGDFVEKGAHRRTDQRLLPDRQ